MDLLAAFLVAGCLTLVLTPAILAGVVRSGFLKTPGVRDIHRTPMPHLGGLALWLSVLPVAVAFEGFSGGFVAFYAGAAVILAVGLIDDVRGLRPWQKLAGQAAAGLAFALLGGDVGALTNPFGHMVHLGWIGIPLSVLWVVAVINTVNLVDGLDGLAAGTTAVAALVMLLVASHRGEGDVAILAAALAGSTIGFLRYNFEPARIFMGDTGSGFLGFALAALAVIGSVKDTTALTLGAPVVALALPIFDTGFAIVRRVRARQPIGLGDRQHIHHRLLDRGLGQRRTVLLLYGITALFGAVAVAIVDLPSEVGIVTGVLLTGVLALVAWRLGIFRVTREVEPPSQEAGHSS